MKKILVHMCCAPCASYSGKKLMLEGYEVILFFSNSNIFPEDEYTRRLEAGKKLSGIYKTELLEDDYRHDLWLKAVYGYEDEPEKGKRCKKCFEYNLKRTSDAADKLNIPYFTTTLTISPHKKSKDIFRAGSRFKKYLPFDFKKENGFLKSMEFSKKYSLYRQNYCGCEFSLNSQQNK